MMHNTGIKSGSTDIATGALSVTGPQPAWMTLDEARERAFTGEVVFEVDPEVLAYLDNGVVYYAERASDTPLGRRLLEAEKRFEYEGSAWRFLTALIYRTLKGEAGFNFAA